jgi:small subunit ribosomal protein S6
MAKGRKMALSKYETVFIINPNVESEDVERIIERVQNLISDNGGSITKVDNWGKKRLAYEVRGRKDGIYIIINFEADAQIVLTRARHYGLDEQIIKHMTLRDEKPPESKTETDAEEKPASKEDKDKDDEKGEEDEEE